MPDEVSAGAVLHRWPDPDAEPRYLLLRYTAGHWDFPKGHVEAGEDEVDAMLREVEEETGIPPSAVEVLPGFHKPNRYTYRRDGEPRSKVVWYRLARTHVEDVELSREHTDWAWLPFEVACERITYDGTEAILETAHPLVVEQGPGRSGT